MVIAQTVSLQLFWESPIGYCNFVSSLIKFSVHKKKKKDSTPLIVHQSVISEGPTNNDICYTRHMTYDIWSSNPKKLFKDKSPYSFEIVAKQVTISYLRSRNNPFHDYFEKLTLQHSNQNGPYICL